MEKETFRIESISISKYGSSCGQIKISGKVKANHFNYSFVSSDLNLVQWANDKKCDKHKESLNLLITQCLSYNDCYLDYSLN